jgi:hypothetical protein
MLQASFFGGRSSHGARAERPRRSVSVQKDTEDPRTKGEGETLILANPWTTDGESLPRKPGLGDRKGWTTRLLGRSQLQSTQRDDPALALQPPHTNLGPDERRIAALSMSMVLNSLRQTHWFQCTLLRETWTTNASPQSAVAEVDAQGGQPLHLWALQRLSPTVYRDCPRRRLHRMTASHRWLHVLTSRELGR